MHTHVMQVPPTITLVTGFNQRVKQARERLGISQAELARRAGVTPGAIGNLEAGTRASSRNLLKLAHALEVRPEWLETGVGPDSDKPRLGLTLEQLQKTLDIRTVVPKRTREQLMSGELGEEFEWALDDDALTPDYVRGTSLVWSTRKTPAVGSVLLLQDSDGQLHVRLLAQGKGGQRLARAPNPNYASFELDTDALRILAVAAWQPMP